ncbi:MAG: 6-phosphofructokinase [Bacteroidota bacterium]
MKRIAVFTSGGDAPGMNACIRAVVRAGIYHGLEVFGIYNGYNGMIEGDFIKMESHSVSNIIQRGGTILKTARSEQFRNADGMQKAKEQLNNKGIDAVVAIGGDGTFKGADEFSRKFDIPFVGIPATIDNDMYGTDYTIGYDTAVNTVMEAVDRIRDTADAHNRLFIVEVMGRDAGFIALRSGIASGSEAILIPETETHIDQLVKLLQQGWSRKKSSSIIIVAEGDDAGGAFEVAGKVKEKFNEYDVRVSILGHIQRGGSPTCMDRVLASMLGIAAVKALLEGKTNIMIGIVNKDQIIYTPFNKAVKHHKEINKNLLKMVEILSI